MSVEIIGKLKPKNSGNFKLIDTKDIETKDGQDLQTYLDNLNFSGGEGIITDKNIIYYGTSDLDNVNTEYILSNFNKLKINIEDETIINFIVKDEDSKYLYLATPFILGEPIHGFCENRFLGDGGLDWCSWDGKNEYKLIYIPNSYGVMQGFILKRSDYKLGIDNEDLEVYFYFNRKEEN